MCVCVCSCVCVPVGFSVLVDPVGRVFANDP